MTRTMYEKIISRNLIVGTDETPDRLYVDLHLVHDLSPQAFSALRSKGRTVRRPDLTLATADHGVSTQRRGLLGPTVSTEEQPQIRALRENCEEFGVPLFGLGSKSQGIVHVISPELGLTLPGMVVACGDSHTPSHGALGALGLGIGTSDIEHVLATQCVVLPNLKTMRVRLIGRLAEGISAKDLALGLVAYFRASDARGHVIEFQGEALKQLSVEGRLTLCNLSAEMGARAALIAPDDVTIDYVVGRRFAPKGLALEQALDYWLTLASDTDASFDTEVEFDVSSLSPTVTWGTTPAMSVSVNGVVPRPDETTAPADTIRALKYMGLEGGEAMSDLEVDVVFIGSCANGRLEDLRAAAAVLKGRRIASRVRGLVVPGSQLVKLAAEQEGLDEIFIESGFEWREPGCSMCLGMNDDVLNSGERCAATSNRNFEGRQGPGGRTHLVSPAVAAATAIVGHFTDPKMLP
ncbi:3-isopropylmalate dehydratase large subunit [Arthrobacter sp. MI7-26]|uniref:3-isopropylmalate dehydratase large subunit n=1 Tax=Arthrobacter sp. MI7-26 TaxID=2993653 RepID=UPI0022487838|nr:3-isopropylmalate dehydratase large subunit [Arthrobacter sp. MI7-26]MCX2750325.1 3-isopropylmalate dehydratase large subunit [Arthrobacter sp. MI7-26]